MDYGKAEGIRKKGLAGLITDNLVGGQGIGSSFGSAISDRTKATFTGIQEKFDPLNVAKTLTGGSKLAPALLGRLTGRKQSTIEHFAGKSKSVSRGISSQTGGTLNEDFGKEILGLIYEELKKAEEDREILESSRKIDAEKEEETLNDRNQAIIEAVTGRRKQEETEKEKAKKRIKELEEKVKELEASKEVPKPEVKPPTAAPAPTPKPPTAAPAPTPKPPTAAPAPKPEVKPPTAAAPKPEVKPPTAAPAPTPKPPTAAPAPKPEVKPPTAAPAPTVKPPTAAKLPGKEGVIQAGKGVIGVLTAALVASGITNAYAQKAILANVGKETGFQPKSENLKGYANTSNQRIREVFTTRAAKYTDEELNQIKKDEYKFGEMVYGKDTAIGQSMGNKEEGDGYKYRGRGAIQLTGKNNYKEYSKVVGQDLVANPELVNQPEIDYKIVAEFVKKGTGGKLDFQSQSEANRAVTQAIGGKKLNLDVGIGAKILQTVNEYSTALDNVSNAGSQIDQSSKENKNLKADMKKDEPAPIVNNTTNINQTNTTSPKRKEKEDDRPAILEKMGRG